MEQERAAEHILGDLMLKCGVDVSGAILRSAMLVDNPSDRGIIATGGVSGAFGVAIRFFFVDHPMRPDISTQDAVDAYWSILRPQVIVAIEGLLERQP